MPACPQAQTQRSHTPPSARAASAQKIKHTHTRARVQSLNRREWDEKGRKLSEAPSKWWITSSRRERSACCVGSLPGCTLQKTACIERGMCMAAVSAQTLPGAGHGTSPQAAAAAPCCHPRQCSRETKCHAHSAQRWWNHRLQRRTAHPARKIDAAMAKRTIGSQGSKGDQSKIPLGSLPHLQAQSTTTHKQQNHNPQNHNDHLPLTHTTALPPPPTQSATHHILRSRSVSVHGRLRQRRRRYEHRQGLERAVARQDIHLHKHGTVAAAAAAGDATPERIDCEGAMDRRCCGANVLPAEVAAAAELQGSAQRCERRHATVHVREDGEQLQPLVLDRWIDASGTVRLEKASSSKTGRE